MQPYVVSSFPGLATPSTLDEPGALIATNVRVDTPGRLNVRGGSTLLRTLGTSPGTVLGVGQFLLESGDLLVMTSTGVYQVPVSGASETKYAASGLSGSKAELNDVVLFGTVGTTLRDLRGGAFGTLATAISGKFLTVWQGRVVSAYGGITLPSTAPSRVSFSSAGSAIGWPSTNWIDLDPSDGQAITQAVTYGDRLFVFKERKIFAFYGTTVDATGGAIFNYRNVSSTIGCKTAFCATAARDGVYFLGDDGIYFTAGGDPVLISGAIQGIFDADPGEHYTGPTASSITALAASADALYVVAGSSLLVFSLRTRQWAVHTYAAAPLVMIATNSPRSFYAVTSGAAVYSATDTATTDNGTAITWRYLSQFNDLGAPDGEKLTRWTRLYGTGTPTVGVVTDDATSDPRQATVTLGTSPAAAEGYHQQAYAGYLFATDLSGTGQATINRVIHEIRSVRS